MIAAQEFVTVPRRGLFTRARRVRPEGHPRLATITAFDREHSWRRAVRGGQKGYARTGVFVPDGGEAVGGDGGRATDHLGRPGFARLLAPEARPAGPLPPGLRYVFTPNSGEPAVVLYDFALRLSESLTEREARRTARQNERRRSRRAA